MRRRALLVHTSLVLLAHGALAQPVFTSTLGSDRGQAGVGVLGSDASIWVASRVFDAGPGHHRAKLLICDHDGMETASITIPFDGRVFAHGMSSAMGEGLFICGTGFPSGELQQDGVLAKLHTDGSILWTRAPMQPGDQQYLGVAPMGDGGAVVCGTTRLNGTTQALVARFSHDGELMWQQAITSGSGGSAHGVVGGDDGIVITGRQINPSGQTDLLLVRLDPEGAVQWTRAVGGAQHEEGTVVLRSADGQVVCAGFTDSYGPPYGLNQLRRRCVYLVKADMATGDTLWTRVEGDTLRGRSAFGLDEAGNGDLIVGGTRIHGPGRSNAIAQRFDAQGTLQWERHYEAGKEDRILAVQALPDGGFLASGHSFGPDGHKVLLIRRDAMGE